MMSPTAFTTPWSANVSNRILGQSLASLLASGLNHLSSGRACKRSYYESYKIDLSGLLQLDFATRRRRTPDSFQWPEFSCFSVAVINDHHKRDKMLTFKN